MAVKTSSITTRKPRRRVNNTLVMNSTANYSTKKSMKYYRNNKKTWKNPRHIVDLIQRQKNYSMRRKESLAMRKEAIK